MKRNSTLVATVIFLLALTAPAHATVLYDWQSLHVSEGAEYTFHVSLPLDDLEYRSGAFKIPFQELTNLTVDFNFSSGTYHDTWLPCLFEQNCDFYLIGSLTEDKKKIESLVGYVPELHHYFSRIDYFEGNFDAGASITANYVWGSCDLGIMFYYEQLAGCESMQFAHSGEWVLREDTAPVPEPGTFVLFALGAIGMVAIRRRTSCPLPPCI